METPPPSWWTVVGILTLLVSQEGMRNHLRAHPYQPPKDLTRMLGIVTRAIAILYSLASHPSYTARFRTGSVKMLEMMIDAGEQILAKFLLLLIPHPVQRVILAIHDGKEPTSTQLLACLHVTPDGIVGQGVYGIYVAIISPAETVLEKAHRLARGIKLVRRYYCGSSLNKHGLWNRVIKQHMHLAYQFGRSCLHYVLSAGIRYLSRSNFSPTEADALPEARKKRKDGKVVAYVPEMSTNHTVYLLVLSLPILNFSLTQIANRRALFDFVLLLEGIVCTVIKGNVSPTAKRALADLGESQNYSENGVGSHFGLEFFGAAFWRMNRFNPEAGGRASAIVAQAKHGPRGNLTDFFANLSPEQLREFHAHANLLMNRNRREGIALETQSPEGHIVKICKPQPRATGNKLPQFEILLGTCKFPGLRPSRAYKLTFGRVLPGRAPLEFCAPYGGRFDSEEYKNYVETYEFAKQIYEDCGNTLSKAEKSQQGAGGVVRIAFGARNGGLRDFVFTLEFPDWPIITFDSLQHPRMNTKDKKEKEEMIATGLGYQGYDAIHEWVNLQDRVLQAKEDREAVRVAQESFVDVWDDEENENDAKWEDEVDLGRTDEEDSLQSEENDDDVALEEDDLGATEEEDSLRPEENDDDVMLEEDDLGATEEEDSLRPEENDDDVMLEEATSGSDEEMHSSSEQDSELDGEAELEANWFGFTDEMQEEYEDWAERQMVKARWYAWRKKASGVVTM